MRRWAFITAINLALLLLGHRESAGQQHASMISSRTIFYVEAGSVADLQIAWRQTDLAKAANLPLVKETLNELLKGKNWFSGDFAESKLSLVPTMAKSTVSYSIQLKQDGTPVYVLLLGSSQNHAEMESWTIELEKSMLASGWRKNSIGNKDPTKRDFAKTTKANQQLQLAIRDLGSVICFASDVSVADDIAERVSKKINTDTLAEQDAFRIGLASIQLSLKEQLLFFANPIELAQVYQADPNDGIDPRVIAINHGFSAIQGIVGKIALPKDDFDLAYKFIVVAPKPYQRSMQLLTFKNRDMSIPKSVPDYVHSINLFDFRTSDLLEHIEGPFEDISNSPEGTFRQILEDMRGADGPGVDLQKDLFAHLSDEVFTISESNRPANRTSERTTLCVRLKDSNKVADTLRLLFKDDPNLTRLRVPGQKNDLWKVGTQDKKGTNFSSPGLMVSGDYLYLASNIEAVRKLVASQSSESQKLSGAKDLQDAFGKLDKFAGKEGFYRNFVRIEQDAWTAYDLLRQGNVSDSESVYAQGITQLIDSAQRSGTKLPDFSALPKVEVIAPYLGLSTAHGRVVENGWEVSGLIIRKSSSPQ